MVLPMTPYIIGAGLAWLVVAVFWLRLLYCARERGDGE